MKTGSLQAHYHLLGKLAYQVFHTTKGEYDVVAWDNLVWADQRTWCECARAIDEYNSIFDG